MSLVYISCGTKSKIAKEGTKLRAACKIINRKVKTAVYDKKKMRDFHHCWNDLKTLKSFLTRNDS